MSPVDSTAVLWLIGAVFAGFVVAAVVADAWEWVAARRITPDPDIERARRRRTDPDDQPLVTRRIDSLIADGERQIERRAVLVDGVALGWAINPAPDSVDATVIRRCAR